MQFDLAKIEKNTMGYLFTELSYNEIFTTDSNFSQIEIDKPQSND